MPTRSTRSDRGVGNASRRACRATDHLNAKRYSALRYTGPGTALTIGLPAGHTWVGGRSSSAAGIRFAPNLPTEEVFTMPHKDRVDGTVRSTKPLSYGGTLIEGFSLTFAGGGFVDVTADRGEDVLRRLVKMDAGAARLGELALVPHNSPVAQTGLSVLQHAVRRERRQSRRARRRLQIHAVAAARR